MSVCFAPPIETGPRNKGEEFLESPILTTPQINPRSPFRFKCGTEVEGAKNSTIRHPHFYLPQVLNDLFVNSNVTLATVI